MLKKLRSLEDRQKRNIIWIVVISLGIVMSFFWINNIRKSIKEFEIRKLLQDMGAEELVEDIKDTDIKKPDIGEIKNQLELLDGLENFVTPEN